MSESTQNPDAVDHDTLDALTTPDDTAAHASPAEETESSLVPGKTPAQAAIENPDATSPETSASQAPSNNTSSLEAAPLEEPVAVPRVGAPDPVPNPPTSEGLESASRADLEYAAEEDGRVREETDKLLASGDLLRRPPITHADQNVLGEPAP